MEEAAQKAGRTVIEAAPSQFAPDESDPSILRKLLADATEDEQIILVTDCCFRTGWTPFVFRLPQTEVFADAYRRFTEERVISGLDVVLICPKSSFMVLWYHEDRI